MIPIRIGLIGKGNLGLFLLRKINHEKILKDYKIVSILDEREKAKDELSILAEKYDCDSFQDIHSFLKSGIDIVVECANIETAKLYATEVIKKKNLLLISIGAFADTPFAEILKEDARKYGNRVYLPSGAIGGLDALKAAKLAGGLESVMLTTRKPANSLSDEIISGEQILFEGSAREAIKQFPKNANVAIVLSLAGLGVDKTAVQIIADPAVTQNTHQIEVIGAFGEFVLTIKNNPSPDNPKTSHITGSSIIATLANLESEIAIGT
ncbi:aspartate dehydrogenase [Sporosarcina thermotolerans]|uniref:L-aspartate dehydrogenase n=1 Tax=Sporosarcina thermotolerans TaxID=633404 RepID=A0AAW9A9W6_9BACL|nr:aspartate dehydrogenase [Sporosarcina thermotolerans]MDW0115976.1 aspartate dehydrogenase [Sporosarcina thermotolerans]WHT46818.1 aspartate dehydrogenase [Sporosarcina thermotolerans]